MQIRTVTGPRFNKEVLWAALVIGFASGCTGGPAIDAKLESQLRATGGTPGPRADRDRDQPQAGAPAPDPEGAIDDSEVDLQDGGIDPPADGDPNSTPGTEQEAGETDAQPPMPPVQPAPTTFSDDSIRCGDGMLDEDELCDHEIPRGRPGSCPLSCSATPECPEPELLVRGCWTQCSC